MFNKSESNIEDSVKEKVEALEKELKSLIDYIGEYRYRRYREEMDKKLEDKRVEWAYNLTRYLEVEASQINGRVTKQMEFLQEKADSLHADYAAALGRVNNVNLRINTLASTAQPPKYAKGDKLITIPNHGNPVFSGVVRQINTNDEGTDFYSYILMNKEQKQDEFLESELEHDA